MRGEQAIFNLVIKKKSGLSINPDIHHSKVFSSGTTSSLAKSNGTRYTRLQLSTPLPLGAISLAIGVNTNTSY